MWNGRQAPSDPFTTCRRRSKVSGRDKYRREAARAGRQSSAADGHLHLDLQQTSTFSSVHDGESESHESNHSRVQRLTKPRPKLPTDSQHPSYPALISRISTPSPLQVSNNPSPQPMIHTSIQEPRTYPPSSNRTTVLIQELFLLSFPV
ncbi:hypothetical protein BCR34DRAFT_303035 [Clohesyomyces aquaticus]|uniref:Uncharacterized protein n=1 Tax=Clohesyomyces aquaticus TaxID=1231657 RepID=A0A1Y1ZQ51_9PLEO|nr:hypothetical protein BCR34DRAFT_303035 [Clohesyomyces aquaticus]